MSRKMLSMLLTLAMLLQVFSLVSAEIAESYLALSNYPDAARCRGSIRFHAERHVAPHHTGPKTAVADLYQ